MIVLKISNPSEVVASKVGRILESLTPDHIDLNTVEDIVVRRLIENLEAEGIRGEVATVRGLDMEDSGLVLQDQLHVRRHQTF
jgi:hypothetical protein